jgi:hypothetical protein
MIPLVLFGKSHSLADVLKQRKTCQSYFHGVKSRDGAELAVTKPRV